VLICDGGHIDTLTLSRPNFRPGGRRADLPPGVEVV
jgi:hypothetical protein